MSVTAHEVTAWVHPLPTIIPAYDVVRPAVTVVNKQFDTATAGYFGSLTTESFRSAPSGMKTAALGSPSSRRIVTLNGLIVGRSYTVRVWVRIPLEGSRANLFTDYSQMPPIMGAPVDVDTDRFTELVLTFTAFNPAQSFSIGWTVSFATDLFYDDFTLTRDPYTQTIPEQSVPATPLEMAVIDGSVSVDDSRYPFVLADLTCDTPDEPNVLEQIDPNVDGLRVTIRQEATHISPQRGELLEEAYSDPDVIVTPGYTVPAVPPTYGPDVTVPAYWTTDVSENFEIDPAFSNAAFARVAGAGRDGSTGYMHDGALAHRTAYTGSLGPGPDTTFSVWVKMDLGVSLAGIAFGMTGVGNDGYQLFLDDRRQASPTSANAFQLRKDNGSAFVAWMQFSDTTQPTAGNWYRIEVDWRATGTDRIIARAYDEAGTLLGTLTSNDTTYTAAGGYGVYGYGPVTVDDFTAQAGFVPGSTEPGPELTPGIPEQYVPPVIRPGRFHPARYGYAADYDLVLRARRIDKNAGTMTLDMSSRELLLTDYGHPTAVERVYGLAVRPAVQLALEKIGATLEPGGADGDVVTDPLPDPVTNLIPNPGAELSATTSITVINSGSVTLARDTTWQASGVASFRLTGTAQIDSGIAPGGDTGALRLGMTAGNSYTVSGTIRISGALSGAESPRARGITVHTKVGAAAYVVTSSVQAPNTAGTTRISFTFTVPDGATEAFIRYYHGHATGIIWWDDLQLVQGNDDDEPFNGSTLDTPFFDYTWAGTAHNSISTRTPKPNADIFIWPPGVTAWDYLSPILSSTGLRLYCDQAGTWRLAYRDALVAGQVNVSPTTGVTRAADDIDRDFDGYYDSVVIRYADDVYDIATASDTPAKTLIVDYSDLVIPRFGGAQQILDRALGKGRTYTVTEGSDYTAAPGQQVVITLPDQIPVQVGIIRGIQWSHPEGQMTIDTRGLTTTAATSWLFAEPGLSWDELPVGTDWTEYEGAA